MDNYLASLNERRQHAWHRAKEILDTAATEGRDLTSEETASLAETDEALDRYAAEEKRITDMEKKVAAADTLRASIEPALRASRESTAEETDSTKLFKLLRNEISGFETRRTIPVGHESRALQSVGGSAIPTSFADFVTVFERTLNPMLNVATVLSTNTGASIVLPRLTADVVAGGSVTAQAGGITEADPTISQVTLGAFKIAHTTLYSAELDQDEVIGLDKLLANAISRPIGLGWGTFFTNGTGTTQPFGFLQRATNGGTALGTATNQASDKYWAASDLVDVFYGLAEPYRRNASWMAPSSGVARMRKFRDSTGQFIWEPGNIAQGQPDTFLGRPVYENPAMTAVGSATTSLAVGDFSAYVIRDVQPIRIDISDQYKFNTDQLALRVVTRRDGDLPDVAAISFLVSQAV